MAAPALRPAEEDRPQPVHGWAGEVPEEPAAVERRCASLARSRGPLRRALCRLAGRFVAAKGWERLGFARAGDYGRERLGVSGRELYDWARVDAALAMLPRLEAALVSGALPWTKVRLVARAAKPEDEERWLGYARRTPVGPLEQQVRACDAGSIEAGAAEADPTEPELPRKGVHYRVSAATSRKWQLGWRLARRVAGLPLDIGACAERMLAEVLSAVPMDALAMEKADREAKREAAEHPPRGRTARERRVARWEQRRAAAEAASGWGSLEEASAELPPFLKEMVAGLDEADAFELDRRLRRAVALEQRAEATLGPWLERVAAESLYRWLDFKSLDDYAPERLGMSARKARALVRIERGGRACPVLAAAYREGRLSWVQAQALLSVALINPRHEAAWVEWASQASVRRLRDDVDRAVLLCESDPEAFARTGGVPDLETERARAEARHEGRLEEGGRLQTRANPREPGRGIPPSGRIFFTAEAEVARLFRATVCTVQRKLGPGTTPGDAIDAILDHCFAEWCREDPGQARPRYYRIYQRDGWRCAVPGCGSYRHLEAHHIQYRSQQGGEEDANLITLCAWHHRRAQHTGRSLRVRKQPLRFELPLVTYGAGDIRC